MEFALVHALGQLRPCVDGVLQVGKLFLVHQPRIVIRFCDHRHGVFSIGTVARQPRHQLIKTWNLARDEPVFYRFNGPRLVFSDSHFIREGHVHLHRAPPVVFQWPIAPIVSEVSASCHLKLGVVRPEHSRTLVASIRQLRLSCCLSRSLAGFLLFFQLSDDLRDAVVALILRQVTDL